MAPISRTMQRRYDRAVQTALDLFDGNLPTAEVPLDDISELKGMFNRCARQDQWDWFSVYTELGEPPRDSMRRIVADLKPLRRSLAVADAPELERLTQRLISNNLLHFLHTYQEGIAANTLNPDAGWVYILSTREHPDILKVGMTTRSVSERVKEINSATGILIPYAARHVFRVRRALHAEKRIHKHLGAFRIRPDREFFQLPFREAVKTIEEYVASESLALRQTGTLRWYDATKQFGFIALGDHDDVFLHASQIDHKLVARLHPGLSLQFDLGRRKQGLCALDVKIASPAS